jgi:hypothetical protein
LNPIEEFFSKWKKNIREANSNSVAELEQAILRGCESITAEDCEGFYYDTRGYAVRAMRREDF